MLLKRVRGTEWQFKYRQQPSNLLTEILMLRPLHLPSRLRQNYPQRSHSSALLCFNPCRGGCSCFHHSVSTPKSFFRGNPGCCRRRRRRFHCKCLNIHEHWQNFHLWVPAWTPWDRHSANDANWRARKCKHKVRPCPLWRCDELDEDDWHTYVCIQSRGAII